METLENVNSTVNTSLGKSSQVSGSPTHNVLATTILFVIRFAIVPLLTTLCTTASVIHVIVFSKMDITQGVTQNLLILSISDMFYMALTLPAHVIGSLQSLGYFSSEYSRFMGKVVLCLAGIMNCPLNVSTIVTAVIALVRCFCVAMPFSASRIFTARRQLVAILVSSVIIVVLTMYLLGNVHDMMFNYRSNTTSYVHTPRFKRIFLIYDFFKNIFFFTCFTIIAASMVFLILALKRSSQFKRQATATRKSSDTTNPQSLSNPAMRREAQVVKTVILIVAIFFICNLPSLFLSILRQVEPDYYQIFGLWNTVFINFLGIAQTINVGSNFLVYYNYNSSFREILQNMFATRKLKK